MNTGRERINSLIHAYCEQYRSGNMVVMDAPKGSGMSMMSILLAAQAAQQGKKVIFGDWEFGVARKPAFNFHWEKYRYIWEG